MQIKIEEKLFFIFDLDDTLFYELDFLKSAYRNISEKLVPQLNRDIYSEMLEKYHNKENAFQYVVEKYNSLAPKVTKEWLLKEYREHTPSIALGEETAQFLDKIKSYKIPTGLITDGRSKTQRNKLKALGIENLFSDIIISEEFGSEKPDERNYLYYEKKYPGYKFYFFGDNLNKDFIVPNQLGWTTVCLKDNGNNIHKQDFDQPNLPDFIISNFNEINFIEQFEGYYK